MEKEQKVTLYQIIAAAVLLAAAHFLPLTGWVRVAAYLVPYLVIGGEVLWEAAKNILHGEVFDEEFLMAVATIGALAIGEYPEAVFVMLFYRIGELFEDFAVGKSRKSITELMDLRPDYANVERDGELVQIDPEQIAMGDVIVVKPGEKIPLDGEILSGTTNLSTVALTGESLPREASEGDAVLSGCVNLTGVIRVKVTKPYGESTVVKIMQLVEESAASKAKSENFITRFSRVYTPAVVAAAVLVAIVPPLFGGEWSRWIRQALVFLVISCPCALVVSVPLTFFGGIGGASRQGILVKGSNYLEALADTKVMVFDKTGTLTQGSFRVAGICTDGCEADTVLEYAALAETYSDHPAAVSIKTAYGETADAARLGRIEELAGHGVSAEVDGKTVLCGNAKLMDKYHIPYKECGHNGTIVHVAADGKYLGHIVISDEVKGDSAEAIRALKACGVRRTVMLTGDCAAVAADVAEKVGVDEVFSGLLPADKVDKVEAELAAVSGREKLAFVGDGINDAPVLSRADVGIAMGAFGSDAAIEAADVVLMDDKPSKIAKAIAIARRTRRIVTENITFALAAKLIVMACGIAGVADLWWAVFADVGVLVLAVANATRALRLPKELRKTSK